MKDAAGKIARRGRGQGFQLDQEVKVAVEALAMPMATVFYSKAWDVEDVHGTESYDLICRRGRRAKACRGQGNQTDGAEVILTPNEVRHAREHPCTALFVVSNITVERAEGTFWAHHTAICPEPTRTAEISTAGQATCQAHLRWSKRPVHKTRPTGRLACGRHVAIVALPPRTGRSTSAPWAAPPPASILLRIALRVTAFGALLTMEPCHRCGPDGEGQAGG